MIQVRHARLRAGEFEMEDVSLTVPEGQYGILMGKTGSGKTTLLEAIAGLKHMTSGHILLSGEDVTRLKPSLRNIGYVPQDGALFATMTVGEQLVFALDVRGAPRSEQNERRDELAELLGLEHLLHRYPTKLSGGERQRVALGRAIAFRPRVLLLDEPLSALDEDTREEMYELLKSVQTQSRMTALHVTHSRQDAERLADLVFRLQDGAIEVLSESRQAGENASLK